MNSPNVPIFTPGHDDIVSDTQHGVDTVRMTRKLVTVQSILVLATTYSVIRNEGVKNICLILQNYLNYENFSDILEFLSTGHLC